MLVKEAESIQEEEEGEDLGEETDNANSAVVRYKGVLRSISVLYYDQWLVHQYQS